MGIMGFAVHSFGGQVQKPLFGKDISLAACLFFCYNMRIAYVFVCPMIRKIRI